MPSGLAKSLRTIRPSTEYGQGLFFNFFYFDFFALDAESAESEESEVVTNLSKVDTLTIKSGQVKSP